MQKQNNIPSMIKISSKGQLVIPKEMRDTFLLEKGSSIMAVKVKGGIFLRKLEEDLYNKVLTDMNEAFKTKWKKA